MSFYEIRSQWHRHDLMGSYGGKPMKRYLTYISIFLVLALILVSCGGDEPEETATPVVEVQPTEEPAPEPAEPTEEPTEEPTDEPTAEPTEEPAPELRTDNLEGETITFYHFGDLSGAYAAITSPLIHGFEDAVGAINEQGGIRGATIDVKFSDTAGSVDEAVAAYDRFTSEDDNVMVMFTYGSGEAEALAGRFVEDQIPNLSAGLSAVGFYGPDSGYTFGYAPIYPDQFGLFLEWLTANWADYKPASAGDDIKLAYISWPTAYGQGALTPESRAFAESLGVEIVAEELIDVSPTADATTAILNAQAAGANVIYNNSLAFGPASVLNGLSALGVRDQFLFGANNWAMDLSLYAFLQDPSLAVGMISPFPYLWWTDADNPGIQYVESVFAANERDFSEHSVGYLLAAGGTDIAIAAIEAAIDEVGFDDLTGADIQRALINLGDYQVLDGVMRIDFSGDSRSPHIAQIRQIQGGPDAFVVLQDWTETPDLRPSDNFSN
jgi:branched-chain amino acid transport system substrate-binding protein